MWPALLGNNGHTMLDEFDADEIDLLELYCSVWPIAKVPFTFSP